MSDQPKTAEGSGPAVVDVAAFDRASPTGTAPLGALTLPVLEEHLSLDKRQVVTGRVRVSTRTETVEEVAASVLDRTRVEVTRVPVERIVEAAPPVRVEGETTIVSVVEERMVLVKQLVVTEELHIRQIVEQDAVRTTVPLRRQHAVIERLDADGRVRT